MKPCPNCKSTEKIDPYITRPGSKHEGEHGDGCPCFVTGTLCLNCRIFRPSSKEE